MSNAPQNFPYDMVTATKSGPGPLIYHVRDAEQCIDALPSFPLPPAPVHGATVIGLRWFSGVISLPPGGIVQSVPDDTCAKWEWLDGSSLLLMIGAPPGSGLPGLDGLPTWPSGTTRIRVNGRPMALSSHAQHIDRSWRAEVNGYLDDRCPLWANTVGRTQEARDHLLAAVMSLSVQPVEESTRGA